MQFLLFALLSSAALHTNTVTSAALTSRRKRSPQSAESSTLPPITERPRWPSNTYTSEGYLYAWNTSLFWPTWTDFVYGPTTGPNADLFTCDAKRVEYWARHLAYSSGAPASFKTWAEATTSMYGGCTASSYLEGNSDIHTGPVVTLCDGKARAVGPREWRTFYQPGTGPCTTKSWITTKSHWEPYPELVPSPICPDPGSVCDAMLSSYSNRAASYSATAASNAADRRDPKSPLPPYLCYSKSSQSQTPVNACTACYIDVASATLYYWPTTSAAPLTNCTSTKFNAAEPTTVARPKTAVVDGRTLTSPGVYLSVGRIRGARITPAYRIPDYEMSAECGNPVSNTFITLKEEDVSSIRDRFFGGIPQGTVEGSAFPFNFADLATSTINGDSAIPLVPWEAYNGGPQCIYGWGSACTMIRNDYRPWLSVPSVIPEIRSEWKSCWPWYKPPIPSLVPLDVGDGPITSAAAVPTMPASPHSTMAPSTATPTAA